MIYDAIVVGGGAAGAVLAYELAKNNLDVLVIEKAALPRYKACGGGLPLKTVKMLPFDASPTFELETEGAIISYGGRQILKTEVRRPFGWMVMRDRFDHFLIQKAVEAGAHLKESLAVSGIEQGDRYVVAHTPKGQFSARFLAGADGIKSVVARSLGLLSRREAGVAIEVEAAVPSCALETQGAHATFDFGAPPHGYGWIFPKADHLSIGVFRARPGKAVNLKRDLEKFIASQRVLQEHHKLDLRGHFIPLGGKKEILHKNRVLLVGDAANLADAWLGEGLYYAIASARMAAETMRDALEKEKTSLKNYTACINTEILPQLKQTRLMANLVYRLPRTCSTLLSKSRAMQDTLFGAIRGDISLQEMNRKLLKQLPRILAQAFKT